MKLSGLMVSLWTTGSCEAELVAAHAAMSPLMWTKLFLQKQGHNPTIMFAQDNASAIHKPASRDVVRGDLNALCLPL